MPFWFVMVVLAEGLIVGATMPRLLLFGVVGAFAGGVMAWLFIDAAFGVVFALICAAALVYARRRFLEAA